MAAEDTMFAKIIKKYFTYQSDNPDNQIDEDLTDDDIEVLTDVYGFEVVRGSKIYRYFIKDHEGYHLKYFSDKCKYQVLRDVGTSSHRFVQNRGGIPVFA